MDFVLAKKCECCLLEPASLGLTERGAFLPFFEDEGVLPLVDAVAVRDARALTVPAYVYTTYVVRRK